MFDRMRNLVRQLFGRTTTPRLTGPQIEAALADEPDRIITAEELRVLAADQESSDAPTHTRLQEAQLQLAALMTEGADRSTIDGQRSTVEHLRQLGVAAQHLADLIGKVPLVGAAFDRFERGNEAQDRHEEAGRSEE